MKVLAVTCGDPAGIGPEICMKLALDWDDKDTKLVFIGARSMWEYTFNFFSIDLKLVLYSSQEVFKKGNFYYEDFSGHINLPKDFALAKNDSICGKYSYQVILEATQAVLAKKFSALVTSPVSKNSINMAGIDFVGHTELVVKMNQSRDFAMLQYSAELIVIFVTTHIALKDIFSHITTERIIIVGKLLYDFLSKTKKNVSIAIAGLNPHAGENHLMGDEEIKIIQPAIKQLRLNKIDIDGPFPPDTIFLPKMRQKYDGFISLYHDQGHIPFKLLSFDSGVNITLGLNNMIRTSVDHGVAFDIAWQGKASYNSLKEACLKAKFLLI